MIVLYQCLLHVIECWHDKNVIAGSDRAKVVENSRWHWWDSMQWTAIYLGIAHLANDYVYVATGLFIRFFLLQVLLNKLRGLPYTYLGKGKLDTFCNLYLGKKTTLIVKTVLLLMCFLYEIIK